MIDIYLLIGHFQAGKTSSTIISSKNYMHSNKEMQIIISYGFNSVKYNQDLHIRKHFNSGEQLILDKTQVREFYSRLEQGKGNSEDYKTIISMLGHYVSLRELCSLIMMAPCNVRLFLDESDIYAIDHDKAIKESTNRRNNIINKIKTSGLVNLAGIHHLTATPISHFISDTKYKSVDFITPGKQYKGISDCVLNPISSSSVEEFSEGHLNYELVDIIKKESKIKNSVTIVSTTNELVSHQYQARSISKVAKNALVIAFNTDSASPKAYRAGEPLGVQFTNKIDEMVNYANNYGYDKIIIVGYLSLNRSITVKSDNFFISGSIFSSGKNSALPTILQRGSRVCGYQDHIPNIYTDKVSELNNCISDLYKVYEAFKDPEATNPEFRASEFEKIKFSHSKIDNNTNGYVPRRKLIDPDLYSKDVTKLEQKGYVTQGVLGTINKVIPEDLFKEDGTLIDAKNSRFRDFILKELGIYANPSIRILNRKGILRGFNRHYVDPLLGIGKKENNKRDLIFWLNSENKISFYYQPNNDIKDEKYSIYNVKREMWEGFTRNYIVNPALTPTYTRKNPV